MYLYTVTLNNRRKIKFDEDGNIRSGAKAYQSLPDSEKKMISPDIFALTRGLDKCVIRKYSVELDNND